MSSTILLIKASTKFRNKSFKYFTKIKRPILRMSIQLLQGGIDKKSCLKRLICWSNQENSTRHEVKLGHDHHKNLHRISIHILEAKIQNEEPINLTLIIVEDLMETVLLLKKELTLHFQWSKTMKLRKILQIW